MLSDCELQVHKCAHTVEFVPLGGGGGEEVGGGGGGGGASQRPSVSHRSWHHRGLF